MGLALFGMNTRKCEMSVIHVASRRLALAAGLALAIGSACRGAATTQPQLVLSRTTGLSGLAATVTPRPRGYARLRVFGAFFARAAMSVLLPALVPRLAVTSVDVTCITTHLQEHPQQ